jgi:hypothetical protein
MTYAGPGLLARALISLTLPVVSADIPRQTQVHFIHCDQSMPEGKPPIPWGDSEGEKPCKEWKHRAGTR